MPYPWKIQQIAESDLKRLVVAFDTHDDDILREFLECAKEFLAINDVTADYNERSNLSDVDVIKMAWLLHGGSMTEIAQALGCALATISYMIKGRHRLHASSKIVDRAWHLCRHALETRLGPMVNAYDVGLLLLPLAQTCHVTLAASDKPEQCANAKARYSEEAMYRFLFEMSLRTKIIHMIQPKGENDA
jgi:hypothetical protein